MHIVILVEAAVWGGTPKGQRESVKAAIRRLPVIRHFAEAASFSVADMRRLRWRAAGRNAIADYLRRPGPHKLHLGAGRVALAGWLGTDLEPRQAPGLVFLDASEPFPFADASFDFIFSEHMIEHLDYAAGKRMLRECRRVLRPGGYVRLVTPDLAVLLHLYGSVLSEIERRYLAYITTWTIPDAPADPVFVINNNFRAWGHQFLYDERVLRATMKDAGFVDIARCLPNESSIAELRDIDSHGRAAGHEEMATFESMALEGRRP